MKNEVKRNDIKQSVRYVGGMTIFFKDKESIYIDYGDKAIVIANRWWESQRGYYCSKWRPFQQRLKTSQTIETVYDVLKLANKFDIGIVCSTRPMPEIPDGIRIF